MIEVVFLTSAAVRYSQSATTEVFNEELSPVFVNSQHLVCNIKSHFLTNM